MSLEKAKQDALAQVNEQSEFQFQLAIQRANLIGSLTNWRKMKSPQHRQNREDKVLMGRARILNLVLG